MRRLLSALLVSTGIAFSASALAQTSEPTVSERILSTANAAEWRTVNPENILVMDLPSGPVLIEMQPEYAPLHVERVKRLAREGFYDNTIFHRVIDGFMAQGGDPTGTGAGGSEYPDLKGRFASMRKQLPNFVPLGRDDRASQIGFLGSLPMGSQTPALTDFVVTDDVAAWPLHCPGVVSMARAGPDSANSQFFIMFADNRRALDQSYTAWGRVVSGERNVRRINRGEPPERPTPILRARLMADLPADEKQRVEVLRSDSETFKAWLRATDSITDDGFFVDACAVSVPTRIDGENV